MTNEGDRWFHIEQERKREKQSAPNAPSAEPLERHDVSKNCSAFATATNIQMAVTEWTMTNTEICRERAHAE
jgi:hypothetical protein